MSNTTKDSTKKLDRKNLKSLIIRFIKFNIVGFIVFLIGTAIFAAAFNTFGGWTWLLANGTGSILQFGLIAYLNKTKKGKIFDSCPQKNNNP